MYAILLLLMYLTIKHSKQNMVWKRSMRWNNVKLHTLRERCLKLGFFWFVFFRIWTKYRKILRMSLYSVRMPENTNQKNSEYEHFSSSVHTCSKVVSTDILPSFGCLLHAFTHFRLSCGLLSRNLKIPG